MCQFRPDMCSKIHASFQLAPVAFLGNSQSLLLRLMDNSWLIVGVSLLLTKQLNLIGHQ